MKGERPITEADLTQAEDSLESLSTKPCYFAHEDTELAHPKQCSVQVQEKRLGCAHSAQVVLHDAVRLLDLLPRNKSWHAQEYRDRIRCAMLQLGRLDIGASSEYDTNRFALVQLSTEHSKVGLKQSTIDGQIQAISLLNDIREELLLRIRAARKPV